MWKVYRWYDKDVLNEEGFTIRTIGWNLMGVFSSLTNASNIIEREIHIYNNICRDEDSPPRFRIENDFE